MAKQNFSLKSKPTDREKKITSIMNDFFQRFKDSSDCIQALVRFHNLNKDLGFLHCSCGNRDLPANVRTRSVTCSKCNKVWWLTATTGFNRARDLRPYLAVIRLMEDRVKVKPKDLVEIFGIALSTAFVILKKAKMAIATCMEAGFPVEASKVFLEVFGKRSIATEKFLHPISEEVIAEGQKDVDPEGKDPTAMTEHVLSIMQTLSPEAKTIYGSLGQEATHFDTLARITNFSVPIINAQLTFLNIEGLIDYLPGDRIQRKAPPVKAEPDDDNHARIVKSTCAFIKENHHRISRKYLQLYIAYYWYLSDEERWGKNALLAAFLRVGAIPWRQIREFVTPASIKLLPA